jgi:hypothetical protein
MQRQVMDVVSLELMERVLLAFILNTLSPRRSAPDVEVDGQYSGGSDVSAFPSSLLFSVATLLDTPALMARLLDPD